MVHKGDKNMIFTRKIYQKLLEWKKENPKTSALLIEGSRRIGKTTLVENFAKNEYRNYLLLDFMYETDAVKSLFNNLDNLDNFFTNLFLIKGKTLKPGDLIIFDEIQAFPLARQAIKKLVNDARFDFIETGSLLSIRENVESITIPSEESRLNMYPMDFEEYLWAVGKKDVADLLRNAFDNQRSFPVEIHNLLNLEFRKYLAIGGMPKVLNEYIEKKDYIKTHKIKNDICALYKDDLHKHDLKYKTKCEKIWDSLPSVLRKNNTRFFVSSNINNSRFSQIEKTLGDIVDSKVVNLVNRLNEPMPGNETLLSDGMFKLYCCDTGLLLTSIYKDQSNTIQDIYKKVILDKSDTNLGNVYESAVAQALIANGYKPYYHTYSYCNEGKENNYEIDFMIERMGKIYAIEVKSGKNFLTKSLDNLKYKYPQIKMERIVVSSKQLKKDSEKLFLPIYMIFCL